MGKTVAFCTLGCKVNQYETNAMIEQFIKKKYTIKYMYSNKYGR